MNTNLIQTLLQSMKTNKGIGIRIVTELLATCERRFNIINIGMPSIIYTWSLKSRLTFSAIKSFSRPHCSSLCGANYQSLLMKKPTEETKGSVFIIYKKFIFCITGYISITSFSWRFFGSMKWGVQVDWAWDIVGSNGSCRHIITVSFEYYV